jgi:hypothetical protein
MAARRRLNSSTVCGGTWDGASPGTGLGGVLDEQASTRLTDDGARDRQRAGGEVDVGRAKGAGLADAQAGTEEEVDEVGQVPADRDGVGRQPGPQKVDVLDAQRSGTPLAATGAPGRGVAYRVGGQQSVAHGEPEDAGQHAPGGLGRGRAMVGVDGGEQSVDGEHGEFAQSKPAEVGQDIGLGDEPVQALGAGGEVAGVDVGQPEGRHGAEPAVGRQGRGAGGGPVAEGFAQPALGLRAGGAGAEDVAPAAVGVAEVGARLDAVLPERFEVDLPEGPHGQRWPSHDIASRRRSAPGARSLEA